MKLNKQKNKMVRKNIWLLPIFILCTLFVMQLGFAAVTLNTPVAGGNYTTITFDCSAAIADVSNGTNATFWYGAAGGAATSYLGVIVNTSANQQSFVQAISIESLADGASYNFTCNVANLSMNTYAAQVRPVTIDNTVPAITASTNFNQISYQGMFDYTTGISDALSGLQSSNCSITAPDATSTSVSTGVSAVSFPTQISGTYALTCRATDYAGNGNSVTANVIASPSGGSASSGASSSSSSAGSFSAVDNIKDFAKKIPTIGWIIIGICVVIFFANKK